MKGETHQLAGLVAGIVITAWDKPEKYCSLHHPVACGWLGLVLGKLPDMLEPALHPNHRQFFHSIAFFALLAYGLRQAFDWEPDNDDDRLLRGVILIAGAAYLSHLVLDFTTPKSLPLLGRLAA